jgi:nucleotide-binding universal stress UspA family protein
MAAAPGLLASAEGSGLLVVGGRGRGSVAGVLLGSVSQQCIRHAPVAVAVVPRPSNTEESEVHHAHT